MSLTIISYKFQVDDQIRKGIGQNKDSHKNGTLFDKSEVQRETHAKMAQFVRVHPHGVLIIDIGFFATETKIDYSVENGLADPNR
jgi:hypothetical protein